MSSELIEFFRAVVMRPDPATGTLKVTRFALRRLFEAMETRALDAEADAHQLAAALAGLCMCGEYDGDLCLGHELHAAALKART